MAQKQRFGIKYPFTNEGVEHYFVDANNSLLGKVRSQVLHTIFTPKGQVIRNPEFGTDLIKHIFELNDDATWESIKTEVKESVNRWVSNVSLNDIKVVKNEDNPAEVYVRVDYSVSEGNKVTNDSVVVQI